MIVPNTNSQTIHQMGLAINAVVRQATGRDVVQNIDMDWVTVAQNKTVQVFSNSIPYMFQRTGGGMNIGNARLSSNKIVGGSMAWNQLEYNGKGDSITGWTARHGDATQENGFIRVTAVQDSAGMGLTGGDTGYHVTDVIQNHKYLIVAQVRKPTAGSFKLSYNGGTAQDSIVVPANAWTTIGAVWTYTTDIVNGKLYLLTSASNGDVVDYRNIMSFDLTQMFGTTIADYIYSLDQATAGAGVAWFRKYFPDAYYDYNAGELLSVSGLISHDMTGFNQWDEVWENGYITDASGANAYSNVFIRSKNYIRILPDTSYYFHNGGAVSNADVYFYNANKEYLGRDTGGHQTLTNANQIFTTPSDAYYMRFYMGSAYGTTYRNNICINFSNPDMNGKYEPYQLHSYPLDSDIILRGIPKLDTDNHLYYDGDIYHADGKVDRRYGVVDMGALTWSLAGGGTEHARFETQLPYDTIAVGQSGIMPNMICPKYETSYFTAVYYHTKDKIIATWSSTATGTTKTLAVYDSSYTDAVTFKTDMSGVYLVYELAYPTTEEADPFTDPQVVSPYGTEEYISTGIVPVGNETQYLELSDTNM